MNRGSKLKRFAGGMLVVPGLVLAFFFALTLAGCLSVADERTVSG